MTGTRKIILVDNEASPRVSWTVLFRNEGYTTFEAASLEQALLLLRREEPSVILADAKLDDGSGIDLLRKAREIDPSVEVIIVAMHGTVVSAVEAMHHGAFTYLSEPLDVSQLLLSVRKACERRSLRLEANRNRSRLVSETGFEHIIAESPAMRTLIDLAKRMSDSAATVLIEGESGTGKELMARALHSHGVRHNRPFVVVNCSAIPETLLESELFGFVKGAFTGAQGDRIGLFQEAHTGTLVLDEIGELPLMLQAKLLRVMQEGEIHRLGDNATIPVDVRVIGVTNRDLQSMVTKGTFREDLYYRLNVLRLYIPPLRERREDILPLARNFLQIQARKIGKPALHFSERAVESIQSQYWRGNVRELENAIERAAILCEGEQIEIRNLHPSLDVGESVPPAYDGKTLEEVEKEVIIHTLRKFHFNQSEVARRLGIGRNTLWRKMKLYHIPAQP